MDLFEPSEWQKQWTTFRNAPFILFPPVVIVAIVTWWFREWYSSATTEALNSTILNLREQIAILEQRLKLAAEQSEAAKKANAEAGDQVHSLKSDLAANPELTRRLEILEASMAQLSAANNALSSTVSSAVGVAAGGAVAAGAGIAAGAWGEHNEIGAGSEDTGDYEGSGSLFAPREERRLYCDKCEKNTPHICKKDAADETSKLILDSILPGLSFLTGDSHPPPRAKWKCTKCGYETELNQD
jgi:ribosomal protein S27AE